MRTLLQEQLSRSRLLSASQRCAPNPGSNAAKCQSSSVSSDRSQCQWIRDCRLRSRGKIDFLPVPCPLSDIAATIAKPLWVGASAREAWGGQSDHWASSQIAKATVLTAAARPQRARRLRMSQNAHIDSVAVEVAMLIVDETTLIGIVTP